MQDDKHDGKKRRGPVSCAECRRLKLKCDRKVPCSSCFKRGCAALCPNGTLAAGPGNRFVLADTTQLHAKIEAMSRRIIELEEALAAVQAQISDTEHPLLAEDLLLVKARPPTLTVAAALKGSNAAKHSKDAKGTKDAPDAKDASEEISDRFGTLTLGERTQFFGQHAAADYFILPEDSARDSQASASTSALPLDILLLASQFPTASIQDAHHSILAKLASWLPSAPQAWDLFELYFRDASWLFVVMSKEEFTETIFARVYAGTVPSAEGITPHELALFFTLLSIACMADLNRPPYNAEAANYYQLARAALGLDSVIDHPTLHAVRAIQMMSMYSQMCEQVGSATTVYNLNGLNAQICKSLGLHRDDKQWHLSEYDQQIRRHLFWEIATYDLLSSLAYGRPPSFTMAHVDAQVPSPDYKFLGCSAPQLAAFRHWNHTFTQKVLFKVMDEAFGVAPLTYGMVLRLDQLVREHPISEELQIDELGEPEPEDIPAWLILQRNTIFGLTQKVLLFLHRSYFARALTEHPADPLQSKYAQSVLTAFRCAFYISAGVRALHLRSPLMARFWVFLSQAFSACLVLGSIVIKSPGSGLAPPAWAEFNNLYELLERAAPTSRRTAHIMPNVRKLRAAAHEAYTAFTAAAGEAQQAAPSQLDETEFKFLYGHSRLVDNANKSPSRSTGRASDNAASEQSSPHSNISSPPDGLLHPLAAPFVQDQPASGTVNTSASSSQPADVIDAMLAEMYSSYWPSVEPQQQQTSFWNIASLAQGDPTLPTSLDSSAALANSHENSADFPMNMAPSLGTMPMGVFDVDLAWQNFMAGLGSRQQHQHWQGSSSGLSDSSHQGQPVE